MKKIRFLIILICFAALCYFVWQKNQSDPELILYGNVDVRTVNSSFRIVGRLENILKEEGDHVNKGDLLAIIDDKPYQIALKQMEAKLAQAQAVFDYADSNYQRQLRLLARASVSKDQVENSRNIRDQANANLILAKANIEQAKLNLEDTRLYSPSEGIILTRVVEKGTMLNAGSSVYSISLISPIWIKAYIDEVNLAKAVPGKKIRIYTDANPNKSYLGKIGFVSPTAEFTPKSVETPELRTDLVYRLRIQVNQNDENNTYENLRQGMPVTLKFE